MIVPKNIEDIRRMIADGVEENISLDYKAAEALQNTDGKKKEIAKDVSAMANAAGGVIIYGIKEFDEKDKSHLPERITPITRTSFTKEQLEQIINSNISPKIDGIVIHSISLENPDEVIYVVEIPQGNTAHQNTRDKIYYRRRNFLSEAMLDDEIRDVMNRLKHPVIEMDFVIEKHTKEIKKQNPHPLQTSFVLQGQKETEQKEYKTEYYLKIFPVNKGRIYAKYINYYIHIPENILSPEESKYLKKIENNCVEFYGENTIRDVLDVKISTWGDDVKYGPSRFDPVLPGVSGRSEKLKLSEEAFYDKEISWTVYADNALPKQETVKINDIKIINSL
jgi:hypothetical protein